MYFDSKRYFLNCASCHWNSLSIAMTADNPYNIKKELDRAQHVCFSFIFSFSLFDIFVKMTFIVAARIYQDIRVSTKRGKRDSKYER